MELTITQATKYPANFMYIFADEQKFLQKIDRKYANIIRGKKANQIKLLTLSAQKYGKTFEEYASAIRDAFISIYDGVTPAEALVILAQGGSLAGKNWSEGVYGIGALYVNVFTNNNAITVRAEDGHILNNGVDVTDESRTVYTTIKKQAVPYQLFATVDDVIYMSQYNKTRKKYHAQSYSTAQGQYSARTGNEINASDSADIWGTILSSIEIVAQWILSIFGVETTTDRETITAENTLPNQQQDGFVYESGFGNATTTLLLLVAGGALLAGGINPKTKK